MLFGDLVGFTPISEARDPEEVRELLSSYFERARSVVERYGGTVEKFIGDAVFAVWGVPVAREDDAERAVRAGLDLTSTVTALGETLGIDGLAMRVGITTGQVAVTLGAVGEGMVAGDAVNTAARVQSVAEPRQVWVDDTTRSLTTASLAYSPVGSFDLKGKSVKVPLFHAVRTTGIVGGEQRVDGLEAPFVGRDRDLGLVKELFHGTIEEGRPRLVLIAGEPGIGKSRLAWEFEKYLDAIPTHTTFWMRGRCLSYGEGVAGRVVAELIRYLLRLSDSDDDATASAVLDARLAEHVHDEADRTVLRPRLQSLLGLTDASFEQTDLFACWRAFLEWLTRDGDSVTIVIDDLQWADDGLFDFLDHLLEAAKAPIFVVALARPEVTTVRPGIGSGRRSTTVFLEPLTDAPMAGLLDGLVAGLSPVMRDELVRRSEGVPLYGVETIRALIDRDIVVPREGRYSVDPVAAASLDLDALGPPASLRSLLGARLDALPDDERRNVQDASVLGLTFTRDGIQCLTPPDVDLDGALERLRHKEIFTVETDPRSPERGQLRFVQALLRTVAYETLSRRDRQARHLAAADFLSRLPDNDALAAVIAEHYLDAIAAMPAAPEAETARAEAWRLLEVAAEHARGVGAGRNAVAHLLRLLDLSPPDEVLLRVTLKLGALTHFGPEPAEALRRIDAAAPVAAALGRDVDLLELRSNRAFWLLGNGEAHAAYAEICEVIDGCLGRPECVHVLARALRRVCTCAQALGDAEIARDYTNRCLDDIERFGDDADFAEYLQGMSMHFGLAGYRRLTQLMRRAALPLFDSRDTVSVVALFNLVAAEANDDPREAWDLLGEAHRREDALGMSNIAGDAHLVMLAAILGTPEAVAEAKRTVARVRADESDLQPDWLSYLSAGSAVLAWRLGDASLVLPAVDSEAESTDPVSSGWWHMREAVVAAFAGDDARAGELAALAVERMAGLGLAHEDMPPAFGLAVELLHRARSTTRLEGLTRQLETLSTGQRHRLAGGHLARARSLLTAGDVQGLRAAVDAFDAAGARLLAADARLDLAERMLAGDAGAAEVGRLLTEAESAYTAVGATAGLARLATLRPEALSVV
jgi:class 3 adenylate cyclase